jgi:hypothetical protein
MHTTRSQQLLRLLIVAFAIAGMTLAWATVGADAGTARTLEQDVTPTPPPMTVTPGAGDRILVIEGPVSAINVNVINIYNFNIVVNPTDPVLQVIQLGDILRVTGRWNGQGGDDDDDDDDDGGTTPVPATPSATVDPTLTTLTPTLVPTATIDATLTTLTPTTPPTATIDPTLTTLTPTATIDPALPTATLSATPSNDDDDDDGGSGNGDTIIIITVINITFVNVTVVIGDSGQVWRDPGDCSGLPPWVAAPAAQNYANRCANGGNNGNGNGNGGNPGGGNGGGRGNDDDDDDDD